MFSLFYEGVINTWRPQLISSIQHIEQKRNENFLETKEPAEHVSPRREYMREWRKNNHHKFRAYNNKWNRKKRLECPEFYMLSNSRVRAKKAGLPHTISLEDIIVPEFCPILRIPLQVGTQKQKQNSPSLDRIIPNLGYVPGNVQVISYLANTMKSYATPEQLHNFADWVLREVKK